MWYSLCHITIGGGNIPGSEWILLVLLPASLFDIWRYKVPNALIIAALIISLVGHIEMQGLIGVYPWFVGTIVPFFLTYFFYRLRMIGASDVKVFCVVGSFVGIEACLKIMFVSIFTGAVLAIFKVAGKKNLRYRFSYFLQYIYQWKQNKKTYPYYDRAKDGDDGIIPFTVAITAAAIICLC